MVHDWRAKWNGGADATSITGRAAGPRPMIFVELAPYVDGTNDYGFPNVALLRAAQRHALTVLPASAMASATDWGDIRCPYGSIHPEWKSPIGARAATAAAALVYGDKAASYKNPAATVAKAVPRALTVRTRTLLQQAQSTADQHVLHPHPTPAAEVVYDVHITFDMAVTTIPPVVTGAIGLPSLIPSAASAGCQPAQGGAGRAAICMWFDVDGTNITAVAMDTGDATNRTVIVHAGTTGVPRQIKYGWADWPVAMLWSVEGGLPASAFYVNVA